MRQRYLIHVFEIHVFGHVTLTCLAHEISLMKIFEKKKFKIDGKGVNRQKIRKFDAIDRT